MAQHEGDKGALAKEQYSEPRIDELGTLAELTRGGGDIGQADDIPWSSGTVNP